MTVSYKLPVIFSWNLLFYHWQQILLTVLQLENVCFSPKFEPYLIWQLFLQVKNYTLWKNNLFSLQVKQLLKCFIFFETVLDFGHATSQLVTQNVNEMCTRELSNNLQSEQGHSHMNSAVLSFSVWNTFYALWYSDCLRLEGNCGFCYSTTLSLLPSGNFIL